MKKHKEIKSEEYIYRFEKFLKKKSLIFEIKTLSGALILLALFLLFLIILFNKALF